jgi:hypothetical protein
MVSPARDAPGLLFAVTKEAPMLGMNDAANGIRRVLVSAFTIAMASASAVGALQGALAVQTPATSSVRVVHGIADAGPLDVYIDGGLALIGIVFGDTSGEIVLAGGERHFAVAPTGAGPEESIVAGPIALDSEARYYVSLLGSGAEASVGLFRIDARPLESGQARFRVINGVADAGEIVPVFTGGEALSEPLGFGNVTEYATVDAGTYDFDILDAVSGAPLLSLPQTPFADGAVTDIFLVGLLADGTMQALVATAPVEVTRAAGLTAVIAMGSCTGQGEAIAELGVVRPGEGEEVGAQGAPAMAQGFGQAAIPFAALLAAPHAIVVEDGATGGAIACGSIGGRFTDTGALVVALQEQGSGQLAGVAVMAPGLDDPDTTGVSVFVAAAASLPASATPAAAG